jgi:transcriptional regulator of acetoin/glycerol metabolism
MLTLALPDDSNDPAARSGREAFEPVDTFRTLDERWGRIRRLGLPSDGPGDPEGVDAGQLADRRQRLGDAFSTNALLGLVPDAVARVGEAGYTALIADADGVIVASRVSERFDSTAARVRLVEGASWSEHHRGTNAIGTAIVERTAVAVIGRAHYEKKNHGLVCYAAPIFDPMGELVAVFDVTSRVDHASPLVGGLVEMVAHSLEQVLRESTYARAHPGGLHGLRARIEGARGPAFALDRRGLIAVHGPSSLRETHLEWAMLAELASDHRPLETEGLRFRLEPVLSLQGAVIAFVATTDTITRPPAQRPSTSRPESPPTEPSRFVTRPSPFHRITGSDPAIAKARQHAERFAATTLPVLLLAETGTGKELFARAIHDASPRKKHPFIAVNCGALSTSLLESELFGYAPGAFTGANTKGQGGRLAAAHGGTLFLDEVAELAPSAQAALLRFLEDGRFSRLGDPSERHSDVRLVCATCRDLPAMVERGDFRRDLYYRIRGAVIALPRLRDRVDLLELVDAIIDGLVTTKGLKRSALTPGAASLMSRHTWPGNVRELKMALEVALVLADGDPIRQDHLAPDIASAPFSPPTPSTQSPSGPLVQSSASSYAGPSTPLREHAERSALSAALDRAGGNLSSAARLLGVARTTLYRMLKRHGLAPE